MVLRKKKHDKSIGVIRMMGEGDYTFRGAEDYNDIDLADLDFFPSTILTCSGIDALIASISAHRPNKCTAITAFVFGVIFFSYLGWINIKSIRGNIYKNRSCATIQNHISSSHLGECRNNNPIAWTNIHRG